MTFEFATATRILFGPGKRWETAQAVAGLGAKGLLVTGARPDRAQWVKQALPEAELTFFSVPGEPTIEMAERGAELARARGAEFVIAVGGGSVIDGGKAIAALATNRERAMNYLEVIGTGKPLLEAPLPFIAIPTTAGTGAEVTRNAVLGSREHRVKVSLRSPKMLPSAAIVDPELTYHLPAELTASTGMDALTQLIEPFLGRRANPLTDAICRDGIPRAARALPRAFADGQDREARQEMALASLLGGLALANAGLGAVHGFAAPIGGMFPAPHGAVCAALLPHALTVNLAALQARGEDAGALARFHELARLLTGRAGATPEEGIAAVTELCKALKIPKLSAHGIASQDFAELAARAAQASSMKANPITLSTEELTEILARAS